MSAPHRRIAYNALTPKGVCRLCEKPILDEAGQPSKRRNWHPECVSTYRMSQPAFARLRVFKRDGGKCSRCGGKVCGADGVARLTVKRGAVRAVHVQRDKAKVYAEGCFYTEVRFVAKVPRWEHDHIIPLKDGGTFDLSNLQTLGPACHKAKTAIEAGQRAKVERIVKKRGGERPALRGLDGQALA